MAIPKEYDFNYYAGDLYQLVLYPKNVDGTQYDLGGHTGTFTISTERGNSLAEVFSASAQISASPSRILMTISPEDGSQLSESLYDYDLEITDLNNPTETYTFLTGTINVQQEVTRYMSQDYTSADAGGVSDSVSVIIDGGVTTSVFYSIFDGGTP